MPQGLDHVSATEILKLPYWGVLNRIDRFHLAMAVIDRVPRLKDVSATVREKFKNALIEHHQYIRTHGEDMPEINNWQWTAVPGPGLRCEQEAREEPL
ncbi:hypothetical protein [Corynebacterium ammoniagenes]|uniref:phosphoketolase family protein n=1 Tax=Corynebacterium ammoniagenes TaxID=1697 RepID=UPI00283AACE5|nr:hypothetical protein [Corynebacterium ammoniagenes]